MAYKSLNPAPRQIRELFHGHRMSRVHCIRNSEYEYKLWLKWGGAVDPQCRNAYSRFFNVAVPPPNDIRNASGTLRM